MIRRLLNFWRLQVATGLADPTGPNAGRKLRVEFYHDRTGDTIVTSAWWVDEEPLSWWRR